MFLPFVCIHVFEHRVAQVIWKIPRNSLRNLFTLLASIFPIWRHIDLLFKTFNYVIFIRFLYFLIWMHLYYYQTFIMPVMLLMWRHIFFFLDILTTSYSSVFWIYSCSYSLYYSYIFWYTLYISNKTLS